MGEKIVEKPKTKQAKRGTIKIDVSLIPRVEEEMSVLKLAPVKIPEEYIQDVLKKAAPTAGHLEKMDKNPDVYVARHEGKVIALADVKNGHYEVSPLLDKLKPTELKDEQATEAARTFFSREDILPKDDTQFVAGPAFPLFAATFVRRDAKDAGKEKPGSRGVRLYSVPAIRYVGEYRVFGPGSRATISICSKEMICGLSRRWKAGRIYRKIKPSLSPKQVAAAIKEQLEPLNARGDVTVNKVEVGYYDGNQDFIQPVYRFTATVRRVPTKTEALHRPIASHYIGYIPIEEGIEPVPILSAPSKVMPTMPADKEVPPLPQSPPKPDDPTVGRYVVRNADSGFVTNANEFWIGLAVLPGIIPGIANNFTNAQYYWAYPWEYTDYKNSYVNSENIALTEAHGDWWAFTTSSDDQDFVYINTFSGGYGGSAGGNLCFWAIKACEVIPSPDDTANWADPWWNVFSGLHAVVGYRTVACGY